MTPARSGRLEFDQRSKSAFVLLGTHWPVMEWAWFWVSPDGSGITKGEMSGDSCCWKGEE